MRSLRSTIGSPVRDSRLSLLSQIPHPTAPSASPILTHSSLKSFQASPPRSDQSLLVFQALFGLTWTFSRLSGCQTLVEHLPALKVVEQCYRFPVLYMPL